MDMGKIPILEKRRHVHMDKTKTFPKNRIYTCTKETCGERGKKWGRDQMMQTRGGGAKRGGKEKLDYVKKRPAERENIWGRDQMEQTRGRGAKKNHRPCLFECTLWIYSECDRRIVCDCLCVCGLCAGVCVCVCVFLQR